VFFSPSLISLKLFAEQKKQIVKGSSCNNCEENETKIVELNQVIKFF